MTIPAATSSARGCPGAHAEPVATVVARLGLDPRSGLSSGEVGTRQRRFGANQLAGRAPTPAWRRFLDQFKNTLVLVLLGAALLAGIVGDLKDAAVISVVVLFDAALGLVQQRRAERALAALKEMLAPVARVRRDGRVAAVAAAELVPGDLLLLEAGDRIAADARIIAAHAAEAAEASLTGESQAVTKEPQAVAADAVLGERASMVYMNTVVSRGRLEAVVTATGMDSEMGRVAALLEDIGERATPLQRQLDRLGKRLALIAGAVVALIFVLNLARGEDLLTTALTAIALAVAAIPEGLPAVVTLTLALGTQRMAARHAIVKQLAAVETLGCTTVICTDKTGTLTHNRMAVAQCHVLGRRFELSADSEAPIVATDGRPLPDLQPLLLPACLCNDAQWHDGILVGDPTEGALLSLAAAGGLDPAGERAAAPRIAEIPFDAAHKFMATFHRQGEVVRLWLKGAPDALLARASSILSETGEAPLDQQAAAAFDAQTNAMADAAMRVLAVARRDIPASEFDAATEPMAWAHELTLIGLVGITDPPRAEVKEALRVCQAAGVAVKMVTGDHLLTAAAIARQLGLAGAAREGRELEGLDEAALAELVEHTTVFARVTPAHKLAIVEALKRRGHVVAMSGDGVNDAPALKAADIGVAMGLAGSEVAREAAALVLADDNFATIVAAIAEGRSIYNNIVDFVRFQLSTNIGALLTVLCAPLIGLPTPFTAIQILWVNIIMDGPPALSLGAEPARTGLMRLPPRRPGADILSGARLLQLLLVGLTMALGTLAAYAWGAARGGHSHGLTMAFTTFVLFQLFNIFNARDEHASAFNRRFFANGLLWAALASVLALQLLAVHWPPAQALFDTVALSGGDWALAAATGASVLLLEETRKALFPRRLSR